MITIKTHFFLSRIIPELSFSADGVILNVTLGALRRLSGSKYPEVQLWRSMDGGNEWFKVATIGSSAAITFNVALNVHRYTPLSPVPVKAGDVVGLYQPYTLSSVLRVFMQREGPTNYYTGALGNPLNSMRLTGSTLTEQRLPLIRFQFSTLVHTTYNNCGHLLHYRSCFQHHHTTSACLHRPKWNCHSNSSDGGAGDGGLTGLDWGERGTVGAQRQEGADEIQVGEAVSSL